MERLRSLVRQRKTISVNYLSNSKTSLLWSRTKGLILALEMVKRMIISLKMTAGTMVETMAEMMVEMVVAMTDKTTN